MRISVNELLKDVTIGTHFRVLWTDPENRIAYVIDVNELNSFPISRKVCELLDEIVTGDLIKVKKDPFLSVVDNEVPKSHLVKRDQAWNLIREIVHSEPDIYEKDPRGEMIRQVMENHNVSKPTIYKHLRRYWQRGKTPNALLPDYHNSDGKGKEKSVGKVKRGRPPIYGVKGINVDESTKKIFQVALNKYYLTSKKNTLTAAYKMMIKEFYAEDVYHEEGRERVVIMDEHLLPTMTQFKYWYKKEYNVQDSLLARHGRIKFEKDHRAVLGSSTFEVFGPGSRFQIDATVADVYLVSRFNPDWIIGRPILYIVIDVFSRMVTGVHVGLEGPSWMGAMMALANAASDKVDLCAKYGIKITEAEWPTKYLPEILLADRGELEGYNIERLISAFKLTVENAAPYRADWKGIVEKQFDTIQKRVRPFLPGYVEKDFQERGPRDYRLDAKLTLEQFTQIMIKQVLMYNTKHYLERFNTQNLES